MMTGEVQLVGNIWVFAIQFDMQAEQVCLMLETDLYCWWYQEFVPGLV
jgi:hypothetical protein